MQSRAPDESLKQVKHLVVLMMENRSFDHMLGYLTQDDMPQIRGLNRHESNLDHEGGTHPVHQFDASATNVQRRGEALAKRLDPSHSKKSVEKQIGADMDGFVKDYIDSRKTEKGERDKDFPSDLWNVPMGYYTGKDLPTYDHLAHTYCVCDAWHSSVPGDTWPNRLYALAGREGSQAWGDSELLQRLTSKGSPLAKLRSLPIYDVPAFTRHLGDEDWRWYSHDPAILRAADGAYRVFDNLRQDNFAWFDRRQMSVTTRVAEERVLDIVAPDSFLDDAVKGQLRKVSWIDPNFIDVKVLDPHSNDDHPPSDILAGQQLIFDVYDALMKSPGWEDTVLVVTYDEHGGFYDHVVPPAVSDGSGYKTLGVRVPALIVGPRVRNFVCHEAFSDETDAGHLQEAWDHTALIRSILRLCRGDTAQRAIDAMGGRVKSRKAHLGLMLHDEPRTDLPREASDTRLRLRQWEQEAREARLPPDRGERSVAPDGAGHAVVLSDFQQEFIGFAAAMRDAGLPRAHN
jgi:phospholipase C